MRLYYLNVKNDMYSQTSSPAESRDPMCEDHIRVMLLSRIIFKQYVCENKPVFIEVFCFFSFYF